MAGKKPRGMASAKEKAAEIIASGGGGHKGLSLQSKILALSFLQSDSGFAAKRFI